MNSENLPSIIRFLRQFGELPELLVPALETVLQHRTYPKKHILLKKGQVCHHLYFIEKGMARNFYEEDDKEMTSDIVLDGELLVAFDSFISRQPSREYIELLEESTLYALPYDELQRLYREFPALERTGRLIAEHYYNSLAAKTYQLKFSSAKARYEQLFLAKPEIVKRAPIGIIASYLGMSIETLSRIRSRAD